MKYELSTKQMSVTTNRTFFLRGNRCGHHITEIKREEIYLDDINTTNTGI